MQNSTEDVHKRAPDTEYSQLMPVERRAAGDGGLCVCVCGGGGGCGVRLLVSLVSMLEQSIAKHNPKQCAQNIK